MGISITVIRSSFEVLKPVSRELADRFYQHLFKDYPETKGLFSKLDMEKQKSDFIDWLVAVLKHLDDPDALTQFLLALGERHARCGTEGIHYNWVGLTLLKTLAEFLGDRWTDDLRSQWTTVYSILAEAMQAGGKNVVRPAPKLRAVQKLPIQNIEHEKEIPMSQERKSALELAADLTSSAALPEGLRIQIQKSVEASVLELVKAEVKRHFAQEVQRLEKLSPEELVRLGG